LGSSPVKVLIDSSAAEVLKVISAIGRSPATDSLKGFIHLHYLLLVLPSITIFYSYHVKNVEMF
jgi:hypothetical protein